VVSAARVITAPAAALVANVATRSARLAAAESKRGVATGATVARAGPPPLVVPAYGRLRSPLR